jgi:hypothetical protein
MNAADRRTVHKAAEDYGLSTESVGEGRDRHIVIKVLEEEVKPKKAKAKKTETTETEE